MTSGWQLLFGGNGWAPLLLSGFGLTVLLALASAPLGFALGLALALLRGQRRRWIAAMAAAFGNFFRGIPDLLSLFLVYFGLQAGLNRLAALLGGTAPDLSPFAAGVIALSVVAASYAAEVWIGALQSVPTGQIEAAAAVGLSRRQAFRLVTLPQLLRVALPGLGNLWLILVKDTSLVSTLAVRDLLRAASEASRATLAPLLFYGVAAALYLVLAIASGLGQSLLERRMSRGYA